MQDNRCRMVFEHRTLTKPPAPMLEAVGRQHECTTSTFDLRGDGSEESGTRVM